MIYYAVFYLSNGEIHLKPYKSKEDAQTCINKTQKDTKYGPQIILSKIVKKDPESPWFKSVKGFWL